jgi:hypothetical protein
MKKVGKHHKKSSSSSSSDSSDEKKHYKIEFRDKAEFEKSVKFEKDVKFEENVDIEGNLTVKGTTTVATLIAGSEIITNLTVTGTSNLNKVNISGGLTVTGGETVDNLTVTGTETVNGLLTANGGIKVTGGATIDNLNVTGNETLGGSLTVAGPTKLNGGLTVVGGETVDNLVVTGNETIQGNLTVQGNLTGNNETLNNLTVSNTATINKLTVSGPAILNGGLTVVGGETVDNLLVTGNETVNGNFTNNGTSTLNNVVVNGTATFNSNVNINGAVTANEVCLKDQTVAPPVTPNAGCFWVAKDSTVVIPAPLTPDGTDIPHFQDKSARDYIVNTTPTDPFHGWWIMANKGNSAYDSTNYIAPKTVFIDTTQNPIQLFAYPGALDAPRQLQTGEGTNPALYTRVDSITLLLVQPNPSSTSLPNFRLQADGRTLAGISNTGFFSQGGQPMWVMTKLDNPPVIRPFGPQDRAFRGETSFSDPSNPVFMFDEYCDYLLTEEPMSNVALGFTQYCGYLPFRDHQQKLKTTGVSYGPTLITQVQKTAFIGGGGGVNTIGVAANTQPGLATTTIITKAQNHADKASTVTLAGFPAGPLSILNGTFKVLVNECINFIDNDPNYTNPNSITYRFLIALDTSALPADGFGYLTGIGTPTASVTIGPVALTGDVYRELLNCMFEMANFAYQFTTHSSIQMRVPLIGTGGNPLQIIGTLSELQTRIRAGTTVTLSNWRLRQTTSCGSTFYINLFPFISLNSIASTLYDRFPVVPYNNPFGIWPLNSASLWAYNIPRNNYLDQTPGFEPRNGWWRLAGAATNPFQSAAGLAYYGDPTFGQTFEAITFPISAGTSPNPLAPTNQQYFQFGSSTRNTFSPVFAELYVFGRINPAYTGGISIGYVRVSDSFWVDPGNRMFNLNLSPKPPAFPIDTTVGNPRANIEAACRVFAAGMNYIVTTLGAQAVIIDTRANAGGAIPSNVVLASCFGADRLCEQFIKTFVDTGFSAPFDPSTLNVLNDAINSCYSDEKNLLPSKNDAFYPGCVFKNGKLRLINDRAAGSAGDVMPHLFFGDTLNKNIGNGVTVKFFGDVVGILCGGTSSADAWHQTTSASSFIVTTSAGVPVDFLRYGFELSSSFMLKMTAEPLSLCNRPIIGGVPLLKPDGYINLGPGPWLNTWDDLTYPDIGVPGAIPQIPVRLPGDARGPPIWPPTLANRNLWRDTWLEETIREILGI